MNSTEESVKCDVIKEVRSVKASLFVIREKLLKHGMILEANANCEICLADLDSCEELKKCLQKLLN